MTINKGFTSPLVETVYEKYADMLYRTAYSLLLSLHDAEDATAEVFVKYIKNRPSFNDSEHEKAWLLRVTVNTCHDIQRRRTVRTYTPIDELAAVLPAEDTSAKTDVLESVLALPEKYRVCVILHYFEDFSVEQIAKALGLTKSAVKMRLARAREMLKKELDDQN